MNPIQKFYNRLTGRGIPEQAPLPEPTSEVVRVDPMRRGYVQQQVQPFTRGKSLADFQSALESARSNASPNRSYLVELMYRAMLDPHLVSQVNLRKQRVLGTPWHLIDDSGEVIDDDTFKGEWARKFIDGACEAVIYGYILIAVGREGDSITAYRIPPLNVYPEQGRIRKNSHDPTGLPYLDEDGQILPSLADSLVQVGNRWDLGLMPAIIPTAFRKIEALGMLGLYLKKEAIPVTVGYTTPGGEREVHLSQALRAKEAGGDVVLATDDAGNKLEHMELLSAASGANSHEAFRLMIDTCDAELSKLLSGGILGSDTSGEGGGNRALGQVHADQAMLLAKADYAMIEGVVNEQLIPMLARLGLSVPGRFEFRPVENVDLNKQAERDFKLSQAAGRKLTPEYVQETYKVELAEPEPEVAPDTATGGESNIRSFRPARVG